jgi:hypothetical protein
LGATGCENVSRSEGSVKKPVQWMLRNTPTACGILLEVDISEEPTLAKQPAALKKMWKQVRNRETACNS